MRLKDTSIWNVQLNDSDSWSQKCLLNIRDKVVNKLQYEIWNGNTTSIWYDIWHESGVDKVTNRDLYDARIPIMISIANMIKMEHGNG